MTFRLEGGCSIQLSYGRHAHGVYQSGGAVSKSGWKISGLFFVCPEFAVSVGDFAIYAPAMRTAVYAGSFDPPTNGHLWMIEQGLEMFDRLIVAIGTNPSKRYSFSVEERLELLQSIHHGLR